MWERKFMVWCDKNENVLQWGSEEIIIPYVSPVDRRVHRYFPDFYVKARTKDNKIKKYIVEVKPEKQCMVPKRPKRQTKKFINEVKTYGINQSKWKAATEYCLDRNMEFMILTEKHLKV